MNVKNRKEIETIEEMINNVLNDQSMSLAQYKAIQIAGELIKGSLSEDIYNCSCGFAQAKTMSEAMSATNDAYWNIPYSKGCDYYGNRKPLSRDNQRELIRNQDDYTADFVTTHEGRSYSQANGR